MKVTVVYESMFGNTHAVASAIARGVQDADQAAEVTVLPVRDATGAKLAGTVLLIVGGPTHARGMSTPFTRHKGIEEDIAETHSWGEPKPLEPGAAGPGIREWLDGLPVAAAGALAAAFDTRDGYRLAGGAAHGIARSLEFDGYELVAKPEGFIVWGTEGPLRAGEKLRARRWGTQLARAARARYPRARA